MGWFCNHEQLKDENDTLRHETRLANAREDDLKRQLEYAQNKMVNLKYYQDENARLITRVMVAESTCRYLEDAFAKITKANNAFGEQKKLN